MTNTEVVSNSLSAYAPTPEIMQLVRGGSPQVVDLFNGITFRRVDSTSKQVMTIPEPRDIGYGNDHYLVSPVVAKTHKNISQISSIYKVITHKGEMGCAIVAHSALSGKLSKYALSLHGGIEDMGSSTKKIINDNAGAYKLDTVEDIALPEQGEFPELDINQIFKGVIEDLDDPRLAEILEKIQKRKDRYLGGKNKSTPQPLSARTLISSRKQPASASDIEEKQDSQPECSDSLRESEMRRKAREIRRRHREMDVTTDDYDEELEF